MPPVLDWTGPIMDKQPFLQDLQDRVGALLRNSPAADVERNLKAVLAQSFQRMELVTRDELDAFAQVLGALRARIDALEATIARLESDSRPPADEPASREPRAGG